MSAVDDRRRRRRRLLGWTAPLSVLLMLAGLALVVPSLALTRGQAAYQGKEYGKADTWFERAASLGGVEEWKAPFGRGTTQYRRGKYREAVRSFTAALDHVDGDTACPVRYDLAATRLRLGDLATTRRRGDDARSQWQAGRRELQVSRCGRRARGVDGARARSLDNKLRDRLRPPDQQPPKQPQNPQQPKESPNGDPKESGDPIDEKTKEKIDEAEKAGEKSKQDERDGRGEGSGRGGDSDGGMVDRPW